LNKVFALAVFAMITPVIYSGAIDKILPLVMMPVGLFMILNGLLGGRR
jgi:hypothetical protein